jgi:hypothetical protein
VFGSRKNTPALPSALIVSPGVKVRCSGVGGSEAAVAAGVREPAADGDSGAEGCVVGADDAPPLHAKITAARLIDVTAGRRLIETIIRLW